MKVFMLGWEFPPFISGGLGTACYGLTKALSRQGTHITFVLPSGADADCDFMKVLTAQGYLISNEFKNIRFRTIKSALKPYISSANLGGSFLSNAQSSQSWQAGSVSQQHYGRDVLEQVNKFEQNAREIAQTEDFDIIHAHDWMTFPAAISSAQLTGKPSVVHVHSTEFDRSGEHVNQAIYDIERFGMHRADRIVAVSNYTKNIITSRYAVSPDKIDVVYNGVEDDGSIRTLEDKKTKIVLYLGRITFQKGPDYFVDAAKKVLEKMDNVKFIMAGDGDMTRRMIEYAAWLGIGHKIFFTKFLRGQNVHRAYQMADLYVMPSVSEPFGIAALEAMKNNVPILISKQSGVAETLHNALKVNFWDVNEMANKMIAVLKYPPLRTMLSENGRREAGTFRWEKSAAKINEIYKNVLACA
ncbi:MAG: glycosyltransferase family 4 protein [Phycisphaerales bacterium]